MSFDSTEDAGYLMAADTDSEPPDDRSKMSFLEHLDELRRRILYSLYAIIACCLVTFYYWEPLYQYFIRYFSSFGGHLVYTQPMAGFMFSLQISGLAGLVIASPVIFSQAWLFVAPGLYAKEKKVVVPFVFFASICFFTGTYFAHRFAFPSMWRFFAGYEVVPVMAGSGIPGAEAPGLSYLPDLDVTFSFYVWTVLGMGVIFQMPMVVYFLARFGIVTARFMLKQFKYAVLIIVIVAAVITPSGDPFNLMLFSAPMLALYIVSIFVAWAFGKKRPTIAPTD